MEFSLNPKGDATEDALGEAYADFSKNFTRLEAFRIVALAGIEAGLPSVEATIRASFQELRQKYESLGTIPEGFDELVSSAVRKRRREDTEAGIEGATLVFAHAIIERLIHDMLDILVVARPGEIAAQLPERKVRLADVRSKSSAELEAETARSHVLALRMEKLEKKLALVFTLCGFEPSCQKDGYRYDQERLLDIDRRRQELLHAQLLTGPVSTAASDLTFVQGTGTFLLCTVARHLNSPINLWRVITSVLKAPGSA
jgi:hypothetical protein